ncbi:uncharacterized protein CIMG_12786 [Coccidioides immitis RS]|uniref:Uncharacterized protein n=1 Tax=Coccidioides immitis (strain RS) TaxID=246410 RepID=A0A0D8JSB2_COCIM|nr:uncharacterized protein CIMG_12786 [Coccidioides immitis RS]KJF60162.1 hypothetical protein CIMG_12786 [Coccidioides immitis RS]
MLGKGQLRRISVDSEKHAICTSRNQVALECRLAGLHPSCQRSSRNQTLKNALESSAVCRTKEKNEHVIYRTVDNRIKEKRRAYSFASRFAQEAKFFKGSGIVIGGGRQMAHPQGALVAFLHRVGPEPNYPRRHMNYTEAKELREIAPSAKEKSAPMTIPVFYPIKFTPYYRLIPTTMPCYTTCQQLASIEKLA